MSKTIWKFELDARDIQRIEMPAHSEILCIQVQNEKPCIWALVEPQNEKVKRTFETFGTGHNISADTIRNYIGTFQIENGSLVFHCFELILT